MGALAAFVLAACGDGVDSEGAAALASVTSDPVSHIVLMVDSGDSASDASLSLSKADSVSVACEFDYDSTSSGGLVDVVDDANNCTSPNSCLVCAAWIPSNTRNCKLSCAGTVPSSAEVAADSIVMRWTKTSQVVADVTTNTGVIRIDGRVINWDGFIPDGDVNVTVDYDLSGCDGSGGTLDADETDPLGVFNESGGYFQQSFDIITVGNGQCEIVTTVEAHLPMTGVDTPGATIDISGDANGAKLRARTKICKNGTPNKCKPPNWAP